MPSKARLRRLDKSLRFRPIIPKAHWTLAEITVLRDMYAAGASAADIAAKLKRSKKGVYAVAKLRGLTFRGVPPVRDFAQLIGARRYEDDPRSARPQPLVTFHRPATFVAQKGSLG